ncbi:LacI family transcriptional regulator [Granulicella aggregans]|uniref:LacI family transcriptional regulator n=1 Tax=Granulicella aggregans TaxID=474949 RepID=A0A7W8E3L2_9BACT|nr:LacI family DNA-binding transcriptional regulator [Granulicella aggregans]MBB5056240.1 LacI family transcriptional regulator [Granulicella aggregans]
MKGVVPTKQLKKIAARRPAQATAKRPKIQDVAALAGVSLGTVSAVLNENGRIGEETRRRVQEAIATLGYRPDIYASNMARRQTRVFGVIVSNLQNPFFAETAQAMEDEAAKYGYQISLMATNFLPKQHRDAVKQLLGSRLAGLAVLTSEHDEVSRRLVLASGLPAVFLDVGKPEGKVSILRVDSKGGMSAAVQHLISLGHRDFLFVKNSQKGHGTPLLSHRLRDQGFAAAIRACKVKGVKAHIVDVHGPGADAGYKAIELMYGTHKFTAVIATTDMVAMGVYHGLHSRGVQIPEDVSVVGFDNTYFSRFMLPPLTSVDVPRIELSQLVVAALLQDEPGRLIDLETTLVIRLSTREPATVQSKAKFSRNRPST